VAKLPSQSLYETTINNAFSRSWNHSKAALAISETSDELRVPLGPSGLNKVANQYRMQAAFAPFQYERLLTQFTLEIKYTA